jgi:ubiquinone/menaquinone biosynthesis C-methylase UbiE
MATAAKSMMDLDFALMYEKTAERVTVPTARAALEMVGNVGPGVRLLDVAAGTGALSILAAEKGATVLATDIAPGMIEILTERLKPFPHCEARIADGEHLDVADASFDAAFSIFGGQILAGDGRKGLRELARVVKEGGCGCVSTWVQPPGGGPFILLAEAFRAVFPGMSALPMKEGITLLSSEERLQTEMRSAGFSEVRTKQVDYVWQSSPAEGFLDDTRDLYSYVRPYAELDGTGRKQVQEKLLELLVPYTRDGRVELPSPALIAAGRRV